MSRPAAKTIHQRTVECPTCGASKYRPCVRVIEGDNLLDLLDDHGPHVTAHAARRRAERALREERIAAREAAC